MQQCLVQGSAEIQTHASLPLSNMRNSGYVLSYASEIMEAGHFNIYVISRWCQNNMNIVPANIFRMLPFFYFDVIFHNCRTFINKSIHRISSLIGGERLPNQAEINELILYSLWCCDLWYSQELELKFLLLGCKQWHGAYIISKN